MSKKKQRKKSSVFRNILLVTSIGSVAFLIYCFSLFQELTTLMSQAPESRPSIIFSDLFIVNKGTTLQETHLKERLDDLKINVTETEEGLRFKLRKWACPEAILPLDSPLRLKKDSIVQVTVKENHIDTIFLDGAEVESFAIEPTPIARFSGSATDIREYLALDQIPTKLSQAIIAIEDQRFMDHVGLDVRSLFRAAVANLRSGAKAQGGSTLTMQLVKNLLGTRQKSYTRKVREIFLALMMELRYSKEEILEKYLNEIYFGQIGALEVHGVAEAARFFFNKPVSRLSMAELAMIAGVLKGPVVYSPYKHLERATERRNTVLKKMGELKIITQRELKAALVEKPNIAPPLAGLNKAPYFVDFVKAEILDDLSEKVSADDLGNEGLKIYTTLDLPAQRRADAAVAATVREQEARHKITAPLRLEGMLVAAEPATGFVRALTGGRSYTETSFNRVLNMKRQVGSSFKPIAYLAAFIKETDSAGLNYTPDYQVVDEPWQYEYDKKKWSPKNYEKAWRGAIPLREAFINSINIPMAKIAVDVGIDRIAELAESLGVTTPMPLVPSLALGSVELSAMELLQVYSTFANRGERIDLTTVRVVVDADGVQIARYQPQAVQVVEKKYVEMLNELLHEVTVSGTAKAMSALGYTRYACGKTGTTNFSRDAWFTGFSEKLSAVTWIGFDELAVPDETDEKAVRKFKSPALLTGAGSALPMWTHFFKSL